MDIEAVIRNKSSRKLDAHTTIKWREKRVKDREVGMGVKRKKETVCRRVNEVMNSGCERETNSSFGAKTIICTYGTREKEAIQPAPSIISRFIQPFSISVVMAMTTPAQCDVVTIVITI